MTKFHHSTVKKVREDLDARPVTLANICDDALRVLDYAESHPETLEVNMGVFFYPYEDGPCAICFGGAAVLGRLYKNIGGVKNFPSSLNSCGTQVDYRLRTIGSVGDYLRNGNLAVAYFTLYNMCWPPNLPKASFEVPSYDSDPNGFKRVIGKIRDYCVANNI